MCGVYGSYGGWYSGYGLGSYGGVWWSTITITLDHGVVVAHSMLVEVVAKRVDQILVAPPIFDSPILDAYSDCSLHCLQHNLNKLIAKVMRIHSSK
ncbi:hypothetical protein AHAS_Ahas03G0204300 [Arachis hypogaea]